MPQLRTASLIAVALAAARIADAQDTTRWKAHDVTRPRPVVVTPGATASHAPSDAIVLFNGTTLDEFTDERGQPARWAVRDGYMETAPGAGALQSKRGFGDMQLHIEWATPARVEGSGQGRGNSGVIIMGMYEVQVLDSYGNATYADGQAASIYGQYPPMVNASRGPGEWQTYDIVFRRPRFSAAGAVTSAARLTVFHNGVLVQDGEPLWGPTNWLMHEGYARHADALPLVLQDHDNPVRYRNIWLRPLGDIARPGGLASSTPRVAVPRPLLQSYAGRYTAEGREVATIRYDSGRLILVMPGSQRRDLVLVPVTPEEFTLQRTASRVEFARVGNTTTIRLRFAEIDRAGVKSP